jgi:hypothetical protein
MQEKVHVVRIRLREKGLSHFPGAKVTWLCGCVLLNMCSILVSLQSLAHSSVLPRVNDDVRLDFVAKLTTEWVPDKTFELLYRGSCDSMTPEAFHDKCDGKGPTLVLVAGQSEEQPVCVFGGYAGKSWERGPESGLAMCIDAPDSFLFTVLNPFGDGIVKMAVSESSGYTGCAMKCRAGRGPWFGYDGFAVWNASDSPTAVFDWTSCCTIMSSGVYGDPLGRGTQSLTGTPSSLPLKLKCGACGEASCQPKMHSPRQQKENSSPT